MSWAMIGGLVRATERSGFDATGGIPALGRRVAKASSGYINASLARSEILELEILVLRIQYELPVLYFLKSL